ncbi:MAG: glycosyltransferase [Candidatus Pacebacteria bacterium]|nr:glycosyltransferase [Candidatus Paceibacterota bacterium]
MKSVAIIIPTLNEEKNIANAIKITEGFINNNDFKNYTTRLFVVDGNSQDKTVSIVKDLKKEFNNLFILQTHKGRGHQLTYAIENILSDYIIYMDCDLSTPIRFLLPMMKSLLNYDIVIGSRFLKESKAKRSFKRNFFGRSYSILTRLLFKTPFLDYQCGFKGFQRSKILPILKNVKDKNWFWDTEVIIRSYFSGLSIKEMPIEWKERENSKVNVLKDSFFMGKSLLKLFFDFKFHKNL